MLGAAGLWGNESPSATVPRFEIEYYRLSNGLKVALLPDPQLPRVTVAVAYHVGSKNERKGLTGFAHFFEHMMFRGTQHVPNFDVPLQEAGGEPNAFTTEDVTIYFETVPPTYLKRALYMEAERMAFLPSALDQEKFDTEREVVKNERRQSMENVPYGLADETLAAHLFPKGHPYSWSVIGSMKDLDNATLEDLRRFFYEFYHPANAALVVVGNFEPSKVKRWIEDYFGVIPAGPQPSVPPIPSAQRQPSRIVQRDQVELPRIYWAWRTCPEKSPDAPALDMLADILADGVASRLYQALVVPQWAVEVEATSRTGELDGSFQIIVTLSPEATIQKVEQVLQEQLERLKEQPVSAEELRRAVAKHQLRLLRQLVGPHSRAFVVASGAAQYDDPHDYQRSFRDYLTLTPQMLHRAAQSYWSRPPVVLVVEPVSAGQEESPAVLVEASDADPRTVEPRAVAEDARWQMLPEPEPAQSYPLPRVERATLSNGMELWLVRRPTLPLVTARLVVGVGTQDDPTGKEGLVSLLARVWDHGTQEWTAEEFTAKLENYGVSLSTIALRHVTQLGFTATTEHLPHVMGLVGQMVGQPRWDPGDVRRERERLLNQLRQGANDPGWVAARVFPMVLYGPQSPLGRPALGWSDTLSTIESADIQAFYQQNFVPRVATLVLVGDVDLASAVALAENSFGEWQSRVPARRNVSRPAGELSPAAGIWAVDVPGAVQSVLVVGRRLWPAADPRSTSAEVANRILGGDFLSRLNQNLREKHGYTYGVRSVLHSFGSDGHWVCSTSVRANVTADALLEIFDELQAVAENQRPLTDQEIQTARQAEHLASPERFETLERLAEATVRLVTERLPTDYWHQLERQLSQLSTEEVRKVAHKLTARNDRVVLVVGDRRIIEEPLRSIAGNPIRWLSPDGTVLPLGDPNGSQ